ncbi:MAG: hypothetical protein ACI9IA_002085, partial [Enterobacterales bacterium]
MDIKREVKQEKILGVLDKKSLLIVTGLIFICLMIWKLSSSSNTLTISKERIWTGVVQSGELKLQ